MNYQYQPLQLGQSIEDRNDEILLELLEQQPEIQMQTHVQYQDYVPTTLNQFNMDRILYLPTFPYIKPVNKTQIPLLLANVSAALLNVHSLSRRYATYYDGPFVPAILNNQTDSFMYDILKFYFQDLMERLKINVALIDFNLGRFYRLIQRFQLIQKVFYRRYRQFNNKTCSNSNDSQQRFPLDNHLPMIDFNQLSIGLEFFLQFDVDLFYMKTCSYRGASPRSYDEGLFCKSNLPITRYSFEPCQQIICPLCEPSSSTLSNLQFSLYRPHRFVNGYHSILNCPATCDTTNIIYALTCPCGQYDFIGSTSGTISEVMECIRENTSRLIHDTLLTASTIYNIPYDMQQFFNDQKEKLRLYEHATRCKATIQQFLQKNSHYECFIPITLEQAAIDDIQNNICQKLPIENHTVELMMQHVPMPPNGYTFSLFQRQQQQIFFHNLTTKSQHEKLWTPVDLYHVTIITVLPDQCSTLLREILENLFATHAETKLNMFNFQTTDIQQLYGPPYHRIWCEDLIRPCIIAS